MSADVIQADYDRLDAVADRFGRQAEVTAELHSRVTRGVQALEDGGWEGAGSAVFFAEMQGELYPAIQRLIQVLQDARSVTLEAKDILLRAEEEAAGVFNGNGAGASAAGTEEMGFLDHVGDFFGGMWDEGKDTVTGLANMVAHPIDTAKGIAHAVTHPGEFWDAFKQPYVEAWESGHPWRAIGRGVMFAGSAIVGTKGADKVGKALGITGKGAKAAGTVGKLVNASGRVLSEAEEVVARMLVSEGKVVEVVAESTATGVRTADFLVNGVKTELKTISNVTSKDVSGAVARRALDGAGQAPQIILDTRAQAGFTRGLAERAARRAYGADKVGRIQELRIIGDGFDITIPRQP
jgi:WXG100 family type VII secretion target